MRTRVVSVLLFAAFADAATSVESPDRLRCEYLTNPPVIDVPNPRFSWVPRHTGTGQIQTAYQVVISTESGATVWDSAKVMSRATSQIVYAGLPLVSNREYRWRVRYWDRDGNASPFSSSASFATGLMNPKEWTAHWIKGGNELRHEFKLDATVRSARVFVGAVGLYELSINGKRVGNSVLDPAWTDYRKRALYSAYRVGDLLRPGANRIEVRLGKGRAEKPALLLQLHIATSAGEQVIASGSEWQCRDGSVRSDSLYDGEVFDARPVRAPWQPVSVAKVTPEVVSAQMIPPMEVTETIVPSKLSANIYDVGQLISGWVRIAVQGPPQSEVRLRFAEALLPDGTLDRSTLRNAKAEDRYILRGSGVETWEPSFTYHGFRYVEVTGVPIISIQARVVNSALARAGTFQSSNDLLNRLQRAIEWTLRTNFHGIPTDNNQRDERLGWLGDAHIAAEVASANFDLAAFYTKFLRDIADAQRPDGQLPNVVPVTEFNGVWTSDPAWESAYPLLCWHMYREYGDRRILEQHFDGVKRLIDRWRASSKDGLLTSGHFGDWVAIEETPPNLIANFYFIQSVEILASMSRLLGRDQLASEYGALANQIRVAYRNAYGQEKSQTALALAIHLGDQTAGPALVDNVERHDRHLTTGMIGTRFLLAALTRIGRADLAYAILNQKTYPGWGYMLENGATALWELWRFVPERRMKSQNQVMLASAGAWLFSGLAGIQNDADMPGYARVDIDPQTVAGLDRASATMNTIAGDITAAWTRSAAGVTLDLTVPVNVVANVKGNGQWGAGRHRIVLNPTPSSPPQQIGYHEGRTDRDGRLAAWYGAASADTFDHVIRLVWQFWRGIKKCPNGLPYYMQHQVWRPNLEDPRGIGGDQISMALSAWNLLYGYLGDPDVKANMIYVANYALDHGFSKPGDAWPNLPYPYNTDLHSGEFDGDMMAGKGFLQPDKAGSFGAELVTLYKITGNLRYLDAAIHIADTLASKVEPGDSSKSPWPFRVNARTGEVHRDTLVASYTSNWTPALRLFAALIELKQGDATAYHRASRIAMGWLGSQPQVTNKWGPFFEDVKTSVWSDTEINADTLAAHILEHPEWSPRWRDESKAIIDWTLRTFGNTKYEKWGVTAINEQTGYMVEGNSHTARHAAVELLLCEKTGDCSSKQDAIRRLNWATYWVGDDGRNRYPDALHWMTDGYGDFVRHFLRAMASAPELAPDHQNHLLRTTSVIRSIAYDDSRIVYSKFDNVSTETLKLGAWAPKSVSGGRMHWNGETGVLTVESSAGTVTILR